jgi:hypothetical protein
MSANPGPSTHLILEPNPLSAAALAEAEAAHTAQGHRLYEARLAQEKWAAEMAQKEADLATEQARETKRQAAEMARMEAEEAREMQTQLQLQLQALAAADAEAAQAFAAK